MPLVSPIQADFSGGELGPHNDGRVEIEQYGRSLEKCYNYIPTLEGPLVRRPGTVYVADVKDPSKPPTFIPFKFSDTQHYVLEFGDKYIRFYRNGAQVTIAGSAFPIGQVDQSISQDAFGFRGTAILASPLPLKGLRYAQIGTTITSGSTFSVASILELLSPYTYQEAQGLKYAQKNDSLYLVCSTRPIHKLQRFSHEEWMLLPVKTLDGPYLPLNSYRDAGDSTEIQLVPRRDATSIKPNFLSPFVYVNTAPRFTITNIANSGGSIRVSIDGQHNYRNGQRVFIFGVNGTTEANNSSTIRAHESTPITVVDSSAFDLIGKTFVNVWTGCGVVYPALLENTAAGVDNGRLVGLRSSSSRLWGYIWDGTFTGIASGASRDNYELIVPTPASFIMALDRASGANVTAFQSSSAIPVWRLGMWNSSAAIGQPQGITFHQDRLVLCGTPNYPDEFVASESGFYETFLPNNSVDDVTVRATDALQFSLTSENKDPLVWAKSGHKGLLFGSLSNEFLVTPTINNEALTPTNINSEIVGRFGSANVDAERSGDAIIYVQNSQRKLRELNYFININKHKSVLINKYADHVAFPSVIKLAVQNEYYPSVYALRSDGTLAAMTFDRDEQTVKSGWYVIELGGSVDSSYNPPDIKTMAVINDQTGKYEQLWMAVQRYINGTTVTTIEYMTEPFNVASNQRDAHYVDCGYIHDSSVVISGITRSGSAWVTATSHGFGNSDRVLITDVVGLNSSLINVDGLVVNSNLINGKVFAVGSASTNNFFLIDIQTSSYINSATYTPYFSGGKVRKLVGSISGLTWLKNETVDILADGGIHGKAQVNSAGVLALTYSSAVVHVGYAYKSQAKTLRPDVGSRTGSATGKLRRSHRVAFNLENVGDFSYGASFDRLHAHNFNQETEDKVDQAIPLFKGIIQEGIESAYDYDGQICFEQSSPLPGMIKSVTLLMDEFDV